MNPKFLLLVFSILVACNEILASDQAQTNETKKTFLYFAYGSNLKSKRMQKNNPSAKQITIGKLKDHQLDFIGSSENHWHGAPSSIVPKKNSEVWGVVWEIDEADLPHLDKQESVHTGMYFPKNVTIETSNGQLLQCRTYQQTRLPEKYVSPNNLPPERQPSPAYLNTIIEGAIEYHLPAHYIEFLKSFRHNNYQGNIVIP